MILEQITIISDDNLSRCGADRIRREAEADWQEAREKVVQRMATRQRATQAVGVRSPAWRRRRARSARGPATACHRR